MRKARWTHFWHLVIIHAEGMINVGPYSCLLKSLSVLITEVRAQVEVPGNKKQRVGTETNAFLRLWDALVFKGLMMHKKRLNACPVCQVGNFPGSFDSLPNLKKWES